jgi:hypothetical protein
MRRILPVLLLVVLAGCRGENSIGPGAGIIGSYTLQTANGKSLPAVVVENAQTREEVTDGRLDVLSDRTWSISVAKQVTHLTNNSVTVVAVSALGSYTRSGSSITFTAPGMGSLDGTVNGGSITVSGDILAGPTTLVFGR